MAEITKHHPQLFFDIEDYLGLCQETSLTGEQYEELADTWQRWLNLLEVCEIELSGDGVLAVWLPEKVEEEVDRLFEESPSRGFMFNNLAQHMCMTAIADMVPMIGENGCAPSPAPTLDLANALLQAGLECRAENSLVPLRRYATITPYPFKGGCEICGIAQDCPGGSNFSMVLPGHEKPGA